MVKLDRCPFCGTLSTYQRVPGQGFSVVCRGQGCHAVAMPGQMLDRDHTGAAWNRRTAPRQALRGPIAPCPFCGGAIGQADIRQDFIHCHGCGMMVSFPTGEGPGATLAHWNLRHRP